MGKDFVSFGEVMLRLTVPKGHSLGETKTFEVYVGGSELNVAIAASNIGLSTGFVTKLPAKGPSSQVFRTARAYGVDVSHIITSPDGRMGLYFHEFGTAQRAAHVVYDRENSAIRSLQPGEIDWSQVFADARMFHTSGITAALGPGPLAVLKEGLQKAKEMGLKVSFDLNYRATLWTPEEAGAVIRPLMEYVDILFASLDDIRLLLQIDKPTIAETYQGIAAEYGVPVIAGVANVPEHQGAPWTAFAWYEGELLVDRREFRVETIDRIGAGDAFAAGFLWGYFKDQIPRGLAYGSAMLALKNAMLGDYFWGSPADIEEFLAEGPKLVKR
ncbi:MAG: sugar kinase [Limnochordia bacterium]|jgi:2-dehydro-3-deoxygluconokinase